MAGREISSTLRNLKFMQRAVQREEKMHEDEEVVSNGGFGFSPAIRKKCVVIMEGDSHPGAVRGRISFQSFNPSVDKLAEELENRTKDPVASTPISQNGFLVNAEGSVNEDSEMSCSKNDHKRKQPTMESKETQYPNKSPKHDHDNQQARASASTKKKGSKKKKKHEKNNWSVLRPPKSQFTTKRLEAEVTQQ